MVKTGLVNIIISVTRYYKSFWDIFWCQQLPNNDLDLFHWSLYQYFMLWNKPMLCSPVDCFLCVKRHHFSKYIFNRWIIIVISLLGPFIILYLAIFDDKIFAQCMEHPGHYWLSTKRAGYNKYGKNYIKYNAFSPQPISDAYYCYIYNISQNDNLAIDNKHLLYLFCQKYNIPTIKCILSMDELKQCESKEFIIKKSEGLRGEGTFSTKNPKIYLSQIPNIVIQPRLTNHESIVNFTNISNTLCTFRVCTYTKEAQLQPEAWLSVPVTDGSLTDTYVSAAFIYDIEKQIFRKRSESEYPMIIASKNDKDVHSVKIDGLNEFIVYLNDIHHKYINDVVGVGWDMTKISNGKWVIVECNAWSGFYTSENPIYPQRIRQSFINKIAKITKRLQSQFMDITK